MPRYFFDVINGEGHMIDDEGLDLPHSDAVHTEVVRTAFDMARDEALHQQAVVVTVNVRDDSGNSVFAGHLTFATKWSG